MSTEVLSRQDFFRSSWQKLENRSERFSVSVGEQTLSVTLPHQSWRGPLADSFVSIEAWRSQSEIQIQVFCQEELQHLPPFPVPLDTESVLGRIEAWCEDSFLALASDHGMVLADKTQSKALIFYRDRESIPMWDRCAPFRTVLGFFAPTFGAQMIHGAALLVGQKACLLCGRGGSGKSSTAIVATSPKSNTSFLSEDYTLVGKDLRVHPLYRSLKVDHLGLERMPWLSNFEVVGEQDGKTCYLCPPDRLGQATKLEALLWPDRKTAEPIGALSRIAVLKHLAPSTLFQNPGASREDFSRLVSLCRALESYRFGLGDSPNPEEVEKRLERVMNQEQHA